ncbi:hypothetical protein HaLaN_22934 [Haematococcus lacustris]|uniref:Uncharacterized protein n=1 Tax=Haematococcus lacustris TaxID=44745 RepID=A0A699ZRS0_HAELA|nr:hypothetical protein HaLaN_22934 [Haematococcus lacustris]
MVKTTRPFSAVLGDFKRLDEKEHRVRSFYEPISEQIGRSNAVQAPLGFDPERLAWSLGRTHGLATRHHRYADSLAWTDDASHLLTVDIPAPDRPQAVAALTARGKAGKMAAVQRSMQHLALGQAGDASPGEGLTPRGQPWQAVQDVSVDRWHPQQVGGVEVVVVLEGGDDQVLACATRHLLCILPTRPYLTQQPVFRHVGLPSPSGRPTPAHCLARVQPSGSPSRARASQLLTQGPPGV